MAPNSPDDKAEPDDEFTALMKRASSEREAGNLARAVTLFSWALLICPRTTITICHVQKEMLATKKALQKGINPWGSEAKKSGKVFFPKVIPPYLETRCTILALVGGFVGFGIGLWGGSPVEGVIWGVLMYVGVYFIAISLADTHSPAITRSNLIVVGIQIGLFAILGSALGATTGDPLGPSFALKLGLTLIFLDGILNWEIYYEIALWVVFPVVFSLAGAGIGALVGLAGAGPEFGAAVGALIGACAWYWMFNFFSRPVGLLFDILSFGIGIPLAFASLPGGLLVGFLAGTMIALAVALGILTFIYIKVFVKDQPPKWIDRIFDKQ